MIWDSITHHEKEFEMDYAFVSAWDTLRESLGGAKMVPLGGKDPPVGYDLMTIEQVVERFLRAYPKFEELREKLIAKLGMEHPSGEMNVPKACQLAKTSV
jgi:hypothetical protein